MIHLNSKQIEKLNIISENVSLFDNLFNEILGIYRYHNKNPYKLLVAGGCIRDLLLEDNYKKIKDLDFFIKLNNNLSNVFSIACDCEYKDEYELYITQKINDKKIFEALIKNNFIKSQFYLYKRIKEKYPNTEIFTNLNFELEIQNKTDIEYAPKHFIGVIKIKDFCCYPIDLIITNDWDSVYSYIAENFSFNLCKVFYDPNPPQKDDHYHYYKTIDKNNFVAQGHNIFIHTKFISDVIAKTITFDSKFYSENEAIFVLNNHYPRIKNKYPQYQLKYIENKNIGEAFKTVFNKIKLEELIEESNIGKKVII